MREFPSRDSECILPLSQGPCRSHTMQEVFAGIWREALALYRSLPPGPFGSGGVWALAILSVVFVTIVLLENRFGRVADYRSRNFLHDLAYWLYLRSGLHYFVLMAAVTAALYAPLSSVAVRPFSPLPLALQAVIYVVLNDFIYYWIHRAVHHFPLLWAFHAVHHSQEKLTFATGMRFHPVELVARDVALFVPLVLLGFHPLSWLPLALLIMAQNELQHARLPWTFGPLYKVFVSPHFHGFHHGADPRYHHRNYGQTLAVWDHLFGTAVPRTEPAPRAYGIEGIRVDSFAQTLTLPFRLIRRRLLPSPARGNSVEAHAVHANPFVDADPPPQAVGGGVGAAGAELRDHLRA